VERVEHGVFGYSLPDERYYTAVKNWFRTCHNFEVQDDWIVNTPGVVFTISEWRHLLRRIITSLIYSTDS